MATIEMTDKRLSEVVRYEEPVSLYSRDYGKAATEIKVGDLLKIAANGDVSVIAAADTPSAVAIYQAESDNAVTYIARHAIVNSAGINYPDGSTADQKKAMIAGLKAAGILVRD
ncbi:MAG: head decoration protein [Thiothrix sp.]|uniref:head decoration protein n=1 Tax=Thiothrix sp. TaxID=1032 RepID=UPI00261397C8|nr:head decoration protein [Thiothrix sp.]MDD5395231.1 head decoration protein [Thiothrix sp.]